jgi:ribosome-associated translation inhibitor RaiA
MEESTVAAALLFENGISPEEYNTVFSSFRRLDERLRSFPAGSVELRLSVKERSQPSQRTSLEARIVGQPRFVSTSNESELQLALAEVRDDLIRQITDAKSRSEARNNRALRETL